VQEKKENSYITDQLKQILIVAVKKTDYQINEASISVEFNQQKNDFGDY